MAENIQTDPMGSNQDGAVKPSTSKRNRQRQNQKKIWHRSNPNSQFSNMSQSSSQNYDRMPEQFSHRYSQPMESNQQAYNQSTDMRRHRNHHNTYRDRNDEYMAQPYNQQHNVYYSPYNEQSNNYQYNGEMHRPNPQQPQQQRQQRQQPQPQQQRQPQPRHQAQRQGKNIEKPKSQNRSQVQEPKETRSEILIEQLNKNKCECLVCCSIIKSDSAVWNCTMCYQMFHMYCIKKWAQASLTDNQQQWRCPYCQNTSEAVPNKYTCFCGKQTDPEYSKLHTPHSCGEICGKQKSDPRCTHRCSALCHPGPCNPCDVIVTRTCGCGQLRFQVKCESIKTPVCENICNKPLNCKIHACALKCHDGECKPCDMDKQQYCHSHRTQRILKCGSVNSNSESFECSLICDRLLNCGEHACQKTCHPGSCDACSLSPDVLKSCPCTKTPINELLNEANRRKKCTDPLPTCQNKCNKPLKCNQSEAVGQLHLCQFNCHSGECSPCVDVVDVTCRCGNETVRMKCIEAQQYHSMPKLCEKKCNKKKTCGRHKCTEVCCNYTDHLCTLVCNRELNCGLHKCDRLCHKGPCPNCLIASFDELSCNCGKTIIYPPIRCGSKLPECTFPCQRHHECNHPVQHNCHLDERCPPCNFLTTKMCMGNHVLRNNIPCNILDVSCGLQCGRDLPCGQHKCIRVCHRGKCMTNGESCLQPCQNERPHCSHPCLDICHAGKPCPDTTCQQEIVVKCACGSKSQKTKCLQKTYDLENVQFENLASELKEMLSCKTIDINTFRSGNVLKKKHVLACDEDCLIAERNRNISEALEIDMTATKKPLYSDFLKQFAREDLDFVLDVEKVFAQLFKETNNSVKTKKYEASFPAMKAAQRRFLHEIASYYGFETHSFDKEPNRNIKVFAVKDKCQLPSVLLSQSTESRPKQSIMPHVSMSSKELKVQKTPNMRILNREPEAIELKISKFHLLENSSDSDSNNSNKKTRSKDIDYFDFTD